MPPENISRYSRSDDHCTALAHTNLVQHTHGTSHRPTDNSSSQERSSDVTHLYNMAHPLYQTLILMACRLSDCHSKISSRASEFILNSWRKSTKMQYKVYLKKWILFCSSKETDSIHINLGLGLGCSGGLV